MKKFMFAATMVATFLTTGTLQAQMPYTFGVSTASYQPLTNGTTLNDTTVWDDEMYKVDIPFTFRLNNKAMTSLFLEAMEIALPDTVGSMDGLPLMSADLIDRGIADSLQVSQSPVRYIIEGAAGNRILKLEIANAGFADEFYADSTVDDYFNMQVWLYENGNIIEYRYGSSSVTGFATYFPLGMLTGFVKNIDLAGSSFDMMYVLSGNPASPVIDSLTQTAFTTGLTAFPDSGTVYRFTPKPTGVNNTHRVLEMSLYPTRTTGSLYIDNPNRTEATYKVLSLSGQVLKYGSIKKGLNTVEVNDVPAGQYLVRFDYDAGFETQRFIKL